MDRLVLSKEVAPSFSRPVIAVHGFQYDPETWGKNNPHNTFFPLIQSRLPDRAVDGFAYYSAPFGLKALWRSWTNGRWNRYRYAWDCAEKEGRNLRKQLMQRKIDPATRDCPDVDIICHSLGSRVVRSAFEGPELLPVKRVLILNGAEHVSAWENVVGRVCSPAYSTQFMNICVQTDDVLAKMGGLFSPGRIYESCIGQVGLPRKYTNWVDVPLNGAALPWGKEYGWELQGDDPEGYLDHWHSYLFPPNWQLYRAWLNGQLKLTRNG